jgi:hypothetical protein
MIRFFKSKWLKKPGDDRRQIYLSLDILEQRHDKPAGQALTTVSFVHTERTELKAIRIFLEPADPSDFPLVLCHPEIIGCHISIIEAVSLGELKNLREISLPGFSNAHAAYYTSFDKRKEL